jgi:RimJ/RimL family protein N-acetyltransferase
VVDPAPELCELPSLSTGRLVLRPVGVGDLDLMVDLNSDAAVMTYVRGRPASSDESAAEWRQRLAHQSDAGRGLGYWAGFEAGTFVGWWSASSFEGRSDISGVGYRLCAAGWGRGLATEGARAMIRQAFSCRDIDQVVASPIGHELTVSPAGPHVGKSVLVACLPSWPTLTMSYGRRPLLGVDPAAQEASIFDNRVGDAMTTAPTLVA